MKNFRYAAGCLTACTIFSANILAQEAEYTPLTGAYDFMAIKDTKVYTSHVIKDGQIEVWNGEGMHAGFQAVGMTLFNCKNIPDGLAISENPAFICEIRDLQGQVAGRNEMDLTGTFRRLQFTSKYTGGLNASAAVLRGGEYKLTAQITPGLYSLEKDLVLVDEPGIMVSDTESCIDSLVCPKVTITSGYPYVPEQYVGEKHLHWQVAPVNSPTEIITAKDEAFELKSETPTLAAIATFNLITENLEPGEYQYVLTSDYEPANYTFKARVNDFLDPEISLDKTVYTVGESKEAIVTVAMSYGYPYVGKNPAEGKLPTVTVTAGLQGTETAENYSDEAWATADMHCTAELHVPLDKITADIANEYKGQVPLTLTVSFNSAQQYQTTVVLPFEYNDAGITDITVARPSHVRYYNLRGHRVAPDTPGLLFTSDGRKILR